MQGEEAMKEKTFVFIMITIALLCILPVSLFNYWIDPMWTFGVKHRYNDVQTVINERQQKTNHIYFQPFQYDTLLVGSSRSTYIDQNEFAQMSVYNYSVADLSFKEYNSMIEFAKSKRGEEFERIIIGVDFFKTSKTESEENLSIDTYIKTTKEPFYRYKNLLSLDIFDYSKHNFRLSRQNKIVEDRNYNRENVAQAQPIDLKEKEKQTTEKIEKFRTMFYGDTYEYNHDFKKILRELKENNPHTDFIIFTTPISTRLFDALIEEDRYYDYVQWLTDITDVFGSVYHFMYPNTVTNNIDNYFDGHHFYPHVGTLIAHRISGENTAQIPADFGYKIEKAELASYLDKLVVRHYRHILSE